MSIPSSPHLLSTKLVALVQVLTLTASFSHIVMAARGFSVGGGFSSSGGAFRDTPSSSRSRNDDHHSTHSSMYRDSCCFFQQNHMSQGQREMETKQDVMATSCESMDDGFTSSGDVSREGCSSSRSRNVHYHSTHSSMYRDNCCVSRQSHMSQRQNEMETEHDITAAFDDTMDDGFTSSDGVCRDSCSSSRSTNDHYSTRSSIYRDNCWFSRQSRMSLRQNEMETKNNAASGDSMEDDFTSSGGVSRDSYSSSHSRNDHYHSTRSSTTDVCEDNCCFSLKSHIHQRENGMKTIVASPERDTCSSHSRNDHYSARSSTADMYTDNCCFFQHNHMPQCKNGMETMFPHNVMTASDDTIGDGFSSSVGVSDTCFSSWSRNVHHPSTRSSRAEVCRDNCYFSPQNHMPQRQNGTGAKEMDTFFFALVGFAPIFALVFMAKKRIFNLQVAFFCALVAFALFYGRDFMASAFFDKYQSKTGVVKLQVGLKGTA